jgi:hypothetical protein
MTDALIPVWIIGGPFVALLILAFSFRGPSSMSGPGLANRREYGDRIVSASGFDWQTARGETYGEALRGERAVSAVGLTERSVVRERTTPRI